MSKRDVPIECEHLRRALEGLYGPVATDKYKKFYPWRLPLFHFAIEKRGEGHINIWLERRFLRTVESEFSGAELEVKTYDRMAGENTISGLNNHCPRLTVDTAIRVLCPRSKLVVDGLALIRRCAEQAGVPIRRPAGSAPQAEPPVIETFDTQRAPVPEERR